MAEGIIVRRSGGPYKVVKRVKTDIINVNMNWEIPTGLVGGSISVRLFSAGANGSNGRYGSFGGQGGGMNYAILQVQKRTGYSYYYREIWWKFILWFIFKCQLWWARR